MNNKLTDIYNRLVFKQKVLKLIELIEHNTTSMWVDNLEYTGECILLEDYNSKDMRDDDECGKGGETKHQDNYQFTGIELYNLIQELKSELTNGIGTWV
jgi:hypothetical protein|tara:strand:+ start:108 stop:404 length:297 start_codon:yes stop_codon:yes gene_type:complete